MSSTGTRAADETPRCLVHVMRLLIDSALSSTGTRVVDETPRCLVLVTDCAVSSTGTRVAGRLRGV